eukprot:TRINITY_DN68847_c1_g5_i1.p1 TRINITY_DN68847_c1_g5~~TRINITY_DN68847_c1_g5_i1.p1  ORF type:complete len:513 (+),score=67.46 TRINITY_DN68847_c1_g5_i1:202-1740(+)
MSGYDRIKSICLAFGIIRVIAGALLAIFDCDETFNYWEPLHYLFYGNGFETWEYSPEYALRSYLYLLVSGFPLKFISNFVSKSNAFIIVKIVLGIASLFCESIFTEGVKRRHGQRVASILRIVLISSFGMAHSSTALLPNSFSMMGIMLVYGNWMMNNVWWTVFSAGITVLIGWPFVIVSMIPVALSLLSNNWKKFLSYSLLTVLIVVPILLSVDSFFYGKLVLAPWNIIEYNVFKGDGANLYGTEPFSFYVMNLILNFNIGIVFVCLFVLVSIVFREFSKLQTASGALLWLLVMFSQAHKEERFLFVVYPILCFMIASVINSLMVRYVSPSFAKRIISFLLFVMFSLSVSRYLAISMNYGAPPKVYKQLPMLGENEYANVCVGKEWYRFPSSFFLPEGYQLQFLESNFKGQLPQQFAKVDGTSALLPNFNDQNNEEISRYVHLSSCDFIVDLELDDQQEEYLSKHKDFIKIYSTSFLDASQSPSLTRAFYIPFLSEKKNVFAEYVLLKKKI